MFSCFCFAAGSEPAIAIHSPETSHPRTGEGLAVKRSDVSYRKGLGVGRTYHDEFHFDAVLVIRAGKRRGKMSEIVYEKFLRFDFASRIDSAREEGT